MGMRGHGTYAKLFRDVWTHEKTFALAAALERLGVPSEYAVFVAVGQFHQLLCWCIAESDDGQVGHLPPAEFARIVGWTKGAKTHAALVSAWHASGFLDVYGDRDVRVHDLREAAAELFRKRDSKRLPDGQRPPRGRPPDGIRAELGRPISAHIPESGRNDSPLARAFGSGSGSGTPPSPPPTPPPSTLPPTHDGRLGGGAPQAADPGKPSADSTDPVFAAWNAGRARRGLPPLPSPADLAEARAVLSLAAPGDEAAQLDLVTAYLGLDGDDWLRERGWGPSFLRNRIDGLLLDRNERARRKAPVAPEAAVVLPTVLGATRDELLAYARPASQPFSAAEEECIAAELAARRPAAPAAVAPRWRPPVEAVAGRDTSHAETAS